MITPPAQYSLFGESPVLVPERRRRKFRPETLRPTNGRLRKNRYFPCGLWRAVDVFKSTHRRGAASTDA